MRSALKEFLPRCENCGQASWDLFCEKCFRFLRFENACVRCGRFPIHSSLTECVPCQKKSKPWKNLWVSFKYLDGCKTWIQDIKDHYRPERIKEFQAKYIPSSLLQTSQWDQIIAVSSDPRLERDRLYSPADLLSKILSRKLGIPVSPPVFERRSFLVSQRELSQKDRKKYLKLCVSLSPKIPRQRQWNRILLVDDVMTTGASLEVHSKLLRPLCDFIDVYCLARTLLSTH